MCVVMAELVQAQCLHIYQQCSKCVRKCVTVFVCVREDSPLRLLHNNTQGGDEGAGRALGTIEERSRVKI